MGGTAVAAEWFSHLPFGREVIECDLVARFYGGYRDHGISGKFYPRIWHAGMIDQCPGVAFGGKMAVVVDLNGMPAGGSDDPTFEADDYLALWDGSQCDQRAPE
jgi:hypothetical protein